jgi:hypothetical protein
MSAVKSSIVNPADSARLPTIDFVAFMATINQSVERIFSLQVLADVTCTVYILCGLAI